jgi:hypothetical protein
MSGVSIITDEITPLLANVRTEAQAKGLALVGARAVGSLVKEHLYGLDAQRHQFGNHYYRQAGDSVSSSIVPQGAVTSISQVGFRQRLFGGTIRAKHAKLLTIPANPEAVGKRAREFNDLDFAFALNPATGALQPALVRRPQTLLRHRRVKGEGGVTFKASPVATLAPEVMFWLTPSVDQDADPSVLPYAEQMAARAVQAIKTRLLRLTVRNARQGGYDQPGAN